MPVTGVNPQAALAMQVMNAQNQNRMFTDVPPRAPGPPTSGPVDPTRNQYPTAVGATGFTGAPDRQAPNSGAFMGSAGFGDPRGPEGILARGPNVYMGGLPAAPGAGRPRNPTLTQGDTTSPAMQAAIQRRMQQYAIQNQQHKAAAARRGA